MSWISGIVTGVKAIFGSSESGSSNVMKVASGIGGWIDGQQFTDQEKAEMNTKVVVPAFQKFMDSTVNENTERSRTRRDIAIWVIRNWFILIWVMVFAYGFELIIKATNHEFSAFIWQVFTHETLTYLVLGVGAFFFGAHIIRQVKDK